jgi:hypothetical protein
MDPDRPGGDAMPLPSQDRNDSAREPIFKPKPPKIKLGSGRVSVAGRT